MIRFKKSKDGNQSSTLSTFHGIAKDEKKNKWFIKTDINKMEDSYKSPHSQEYYPSIERSTYVNPRITKTELEMNSILDLFTNNYFYDAISSAFFWESGVYPLNQEINVLRMIGDEDLSKFKNWYLGGKKEVPEGSLGSMISGFYKLKGTYNYIPGGYGESKSGVSFFSNYVQSSAIKLEFKPDSDTCMKVQGYMQSMVKFLLIVLG